MRAVFCQRVPLENSICLRRHGLVAKFHNCFFPRGLRVVREFVDVESAKNPGRREFGILSSGTESYDCRNTSISVGRNGNRRSCISFLKAITVRRENSES